MRIDALLRAGHCDAAWFSAVFLAQISVAQVDAIVAQLKTTLGEYETLHGGSGDYSAQFAKGTDRVLVHLDSENKIDGLLFRPPQIQASSLDQSLGQLARVPGTLSYVLVEGRSERAALNASQPLAVGSAFKIAVLAALCDEITKGKRNWSDVVPLQSDWKSLPSGVLHTWPDQTRLTLETYATEMISISDNTAADALIATLGWPALAPHASRNDPFLTTRQMFILKSAEATANQTAYVRASPLQRATILKAIETSPLPRSLTLVAAPILAIEWHYTVRELCTLMARVATLPLMSINPGVADPAAFASVAFKGGSDTGVINLTTQVTTSRGTTLCFSATLNDDTRATDDAAFTLAYSSVLSVIASL